MTKVGGQGLTWRVEDQSGFDGLKATEEPIPQELGDHDCLMKIEAASLNFRDLMIPKVRIPGGQVWNCKANGQWQGTYPFPMKTRTIPGSDAAGTIIAIGTRVTRFKAGDKVCTTLSQGHLAGPITMSALETGLGGSLDGTFRQYGIFEESGLVHMPATLNFREASTLPCAGVTAWNALYGLAGRQLKPGDTVLTLGTGGVSVFAIQFAVAAGATVISTTSSAAKATRLKELGAHHVINYRDEPNWGDIAKSLTPGGLGVDFVVEVGGTATLQQSLDAIKMDGIIAVVGAIGESDAGELQVSLLNAWYRSCIVRGVAVGSRALFEDMNRAIVTNNITPVLDPRQFDLRQLKEAYQYMWDQKHFSKVVIDC